MIFDCKTICALRQTRELSGEASLELGAGLWAGVLSHGQCTVHAPDGSAALGHAGDVLLAVGPVTLDSMTSCRLLAVELAGLAAGEFSKGLDAPRFADSAACPTVPELLARLWEGGLSPEDASRAAYALLCALAHADEAVRPLSPLVAQAVAAIRSKYMGLYGVAELSEQLGVSKCHLVRVFSQEMGMPPGQFLTRTRIEAAKALLAQQDYDLELIANLCGFSCANYFCRVFKRETGRTPAAWRAENAPLAPARALPRPAQEAFV